MNDLYPDLTNLLSQVEDRIQDLGGTWLGRLGMDQDELLSPAASRPRASILLLSAECCRGASGSSLTLAAVVEIIHAAMLVHGEVLEDARPQHPECRHGNPRSVLVGDCLLALACELLATEKTQKSLPDLAQALSQMCRGRIEELRTQDRPVSRQEYFEMTLAKTGSLFAFCGKAGGQTGVGSPEVVEALRAFGELFGVAFQIADDISNLMNGDEHSRRLEHLRILHYSFPMPPVVPVPAQCGREGALLESGASHLWATAEQWLAAARARLAPLPDTAAKRALQATTPAGLCVQAITSR